MKNYLSYSIIALSFVLMVVGCITPNITVNIYHKKEDADNYKVHSGPSCETLIGFREKLEIGSLALLRDTLNIKDIICIDTFWLRPSPPSLLSSPRVMN